jgi:large subunit ribosomal protein L32
MPVPKKRHSKSRRDKRRSSTEFVTPANLATCSRCGEPKLPHRVCPACGYYKNREVVFMKQD